MSMLPFEWHIFAHSGAAYGTEAASSGLPAGLGRRLERFSWGQTSDGAYLGSLASHPAIWVMQYPEGTVVTRVLCGAKDREGRATLRFHSILTKREVWVMELASRLEALAVDTEMWLQLASGGSLGVRLQELPPAHQNQASRDLAERLAAQTVKSTTGWPTVIAEPEELTLLEVAATVAALPERVRGNYSLAFRPLSDSLRVNLLCKDELTRTEQAPHARVALVKVQTAELRASPTSRLTGVMAGVGTDPFDVAQETLEEEELHLKPTVLISFLGLALLALIFGISSILGVRTLQERLDIAQSEITTLLKERAAPLDESLVRLDTRLSNLEATTREKATAAQVEQLTKTCDALKQALEIVQTRAKTDLAEITKNLNLLDKSVKETTQAVTGLQASLNTKKETAASPDESPKQPPATSGPPQSGDGPGAPSTPADKPQGEKPPKEPKAGKPGGGAKQP